MTLFRTFRAAYDGVRAHRGRSLLTVLGVVIGIIAVVLVVALGHGAQQLVLQEVQGIGANVLVVLPGREPSGPTDVAGTILLDSLTERDVVALKETVNVPHVERVVPGVIVPGSVAYQDAVAHPVIFGWSAQALADVFGIVPESGNGFTDDDIKSRARVVLLGSRVKDELFGEREAVGEVVRVRGRALRVVGVLPPRGQVSILNLDEGVILPYTTAQKDLVGIDYYHRIFIQAREGADVEQVAADVRATLRELHEIDDPSQDDFFVLTQQDILERISTVTDVLTLFLAAIAFVSLLVGGVGIMNIMLVAVSERTREIGLRKAVGATTSDILRQFLFEALILTLSGGVVGTVFAVTLSFLATVLIRRYGGLAWEWELPLGAIGLGLGMALVVGLVFGSYPARRAALKDPVEALRSE